MTSEHRTKVNLLTTQADAPAVGHGHGFIVEGVADIGQSFISFGRRLIEFLQAFSSPRLDGSLVVVLVDKVFKLILLLQHRFGGWFSRGLLER